MADRRETLHRGAGGGLLLPGFRVSGSGCRLLPDPFRRFSVPPLADLEGQGCGDWVVGVLRLGYCLPFLGTPHVPLFPSQCLFPAPSPSQGLFWSISPWSWFPRLLWELAPLPLQASTAFCSWCCRPRGHGVRSSPSPISFSLWNVSHFQLGSIPSMLLSVSQGDCWPPSISGKRTFQCRFILLLVPFFASCYVTRSTSYRLCTLASPRLRRSSPGSWLLFSYTPFSGYPYASIPRHMAGQFLGLSSIQVFQPHTFPGSAVSVGRLRFHLFQGFSVVDRISRRQSATAVFMSCA